MARYIDADAVIAAVRGRISMPVDNLIVEMIRDIPTISPDEVRGVGEWERIDYPVGHDYKCLACGKLNDRASNYCPNCGNPMRMKGAEDDD